MYFPTHEHMPGQQPTNYCFDPTCATEDDVVELLKLIDIIGMAHPCNDILLVWNGDGVNKQPIGDPSAFVSNASISTLAESMQCNIDRYKSLGTLRSYSMQAAMPGANFDVPVTSAITILSCSEKQLDHYFDLSVYTPKRSPLTYSTRSSFGLKHSGDITGPRGVGLLHTVDGTQNLEDDTPLVVVATGYKKRPLRKFQDQLPSIFVVDHSDRVIWSIPCPLDQASIGDATMTGLLCITKSLNTLQCHVLAVPIAIDDVNTGDTSARTIGRMNATMRPIRPPIARITPSSYDEDDAEDPILRIAPFNYDEDDTEDGGSRIWVFIEHGLKKNSMPTRIQGDAHYFGAGFSKCDMDKPPVCLLPHLFGRVSGTSACATCNLDTRGTRRLGVPRMSICAHVSENWPDTAVQACRYMGNSIFILHPRHSRRDDIESALSVLDASGGGAKASKRDALTRVMDSMCINSTCMLGPNGVLLVTLKDRLFWYRGVRLPGLLEEVPNYGEEVTDIFTYENIETWVSMCNSADHEKERPMPAIMRKQTMMHQVCWQCKIVAVYTACDECIKLLKEDVSKCANEHLADILDLFTQVSVLLDASIVRDLRDRFENAITTAVREMRKTVFTKLWNQYQDEQVPLKDVIEQRSKMIQRDPFKDPGIKRIFGAIDNLVSIKGASTGNQNIARRTRAAAVRENVERATEMTVSDLVGKLECTEEGMLMIQINTSYLHDSLKGMGQGNLDIPKMPIDAFCLDPRATCLDCLTVECLFEIANGIDSHHPLHSTASIALPQRGQGLTGHTKSLVPVPMLAEFVNLVDPGTISWLDRQLCEDCSIYRIKLRKTIAECELAETNEIMISTQSDDVGLFIAQMLAGTMDNIASGMLGVPNPEKDRDNTTCRLIRGCFCQLLALMASTENILCPAYALVERDAKIDFPKDKRWWPVITSMVQVYPYTCWDHAPVKRNMQRYIIKAVKRMIQGILDKQQTKLKNDTRTKSARLGLGVPPNERAAMQVLVHHICGPYADPPIPVDPKVIHRALEEFGILKFEGSKMMLHFVELMENLEKNQHRKMEDDADLRTAGVALSVFAKYSGIGHAEREEIVAKVNGAQGRKVHGTPNDAKIPYAKSREAQEMILRELVLKHGVRKTWQVLTPPVDIKVALETIKSAFEEKRLQLQLQLSCELITKVPNCRRAHAAKLHAMKETGHSIEARKAAFDYAMAMCKSDAEEEKCEKLLMPHLSDGDKGDEDKRDEDSLLNAIQEITCESVEAASDAVPLRDLMCSIDITSPELQDEIVRNIAISLFLNCHIGEAATAALHAFDPYEHKVKEEEGKGCNETKSEEVGKDDEAKESIPLPPMAIPISIVMTIPDRLDRLENAIGLEISHNGVQHRLINLEELIFGECKEGGIADRLTELEGQLIG